MKINNLKINGFGKIENKEINLSEHINLIYGKNEAGKTTLLKFIAGMFYGVSKNKNKKEFSDFERYKPWRNMEFSGKINYTLDNGENLEVFRDFAKKNPQIYNEKGEEISKKYNIDKTKGNEFFYEQTKIDEPMFFSTTLVEQKNVVLDNSEQAVLTQKIANILSTGEENASYKKTIDKLNKKHIEEIGTERTQGRPLNIICDKLENIKQEEQNFKGDAELKKEIEEKKERIKNKIEEKEIKINNEIEEEEKIKINQTKEKIEKNKIQKEKTSNINIIICLILFIFNILLFIFKVKKIVNIILISATILFTIFTIFKKIKNNKKMKENKKIEKRYLEEIKAIENNIEKIQKNIEEFKNTKTEKEKIEQNKIKEKYFEKLEKEEIEYLLGISIYELEINIDELEKEASALKLQLYTNDVDYKNILKSEEYKAKLEEEKQNLLEDKEEILSLEKSIILAKEAMEKAYVKMKEEVTPKFTKNLSKIIEKISEGKYNKAKYIDGEGLIVELENGEYVNSNKLSIGTIDQLYLSLRLSSMQEITEEKMPIILDEAFAYYDEERLKNILKYLNENYKENQIIIFTCSKREKELLEEGKIEYSYIDLHK